MFQRTRPKRPLAEELDELTKQLLAMGRMVEDRLGLGARALIERNGDVPKTIIEGDADVNQFHLDIDKHCFTLLALQQPAAVDLRNIVAILKISSDLERIGDLVVNIAEATERYLRLPPAMTLDQLPAMADLAASMLHDALESFISNDVRIAQDVVERDDKLDRLENNVFRDLLASMIHDRRTIEPALNLVLISRHLERVGDHATNIAEDVIFIVAGQDVRHHATAGS